MTNAVHISRDDMLDGAAERRAIAAYRRDGIEECLFEALSAVGWHTRISPRWRAAIQRGRVMDVPEGY